MLWILTSKRCFTCHFLVAIKKPDGKDGRALASRTFKDVCHGKVPEVVKGC